MSCKIQINQHPATSNQQLMNYIRPRRINYYWITIELREANYAPSSARSQLQWITRSQWRPERSEGPISPQTQWGANDPPSASSPQTKHL